MSAQIGTLFAMDSNKDPLDETGRFNQLNSGVYLGSDSLTTSQNTGSQVASTNSAMADYLEQDLLADHMFGGRNQT